MPAIENLPAHRLYAFIQVSTSFYDLSYTSVASWGWGFRGIVFVPHWSKQYPTILSWRVTNHDELLESSNHLFLVLELLLFSAHEDGWVAQPMAGAQWCSMTAKEAMTSSWRQQNHVPTHPQWGLFSTWYGTAMVKPPDAQNNCHPLAV